MTVLLTGVTGMVGERLLPRLVDAGWPCRVLVRPGKTPPAHGEAVEGDILSPTTLKAAVDGVTDIVHLAAVFRTQDTDLIWRSNLEGTCNLLAAAKQYAPTARFIMSSTSNVYNATGEHPGREDDPTDPEQAYPASKLAAERELRASGLNWTILRFPFVYGEKDGHLEALPDHAPSGQWHPAKRISTIHHRDIFTATELALSGAMDRQTVNITDEAPTTVYELAQLVGKPLQPTAEPLTNPWHLHVDGSLARSLGFRPTIRSVYHASEEGLL
jgi:nucleoside-diphosphate-sugar epimerase